MQFSAHESKVAVKLPREVVLESVGCPLGCPPGDHFILSGRDLVNFLPGEFQVVKCSSCGLMRTEPRPTLESMSYFYPESYAPYESTRMDVGGERQSKQGDWKSFLHVCLKRFVKLHIDTTPEIEPGHMLEVGCASGAFLQRMSRKGWVVEGIERSDVAASSARADGYHVVSKTLEDAPEPQHPYDLIVAWMTLEHLHEPVKALRKIHRWSKPGTWLTLSVPHAGSPGFRVFKESWFHLHLPNHLYHYTPATLSNVLRAGGWKLERIFYQRDLGDLVASLGHFMNERNLLRGLAARLASFPEWQGKLYLLFYPLSWLLSTIGLTGAMTIWAKRQDD